MDLHEIVENLKQMRTSASFMFLYAVHSTNIGKLIIEHPVSIQELLLGQLSIKPGSSRAGFMVMRSKCARLVEMAVLATDSSVRNETPPALESEDEDLNKRLTAIAPKVSYVNFWRI
jgi:hypothetical protein